MDTPPGKAGKKKKARKSDRDASDDEEDNNHGLSVSRRLQVIHKYCLDVEQQASQGMLKESDMDPLPTP